MHPELACVRCVQAQELGKRREARDAPPLGVQRVAGWRDTVACARDCTSPDPRCSGSRTLQQSKTLVPPPLRSVELLHTRPANPGPTLATASCGLHGARSGDTQIEIAGRPSPPTFRSSAPPQWKAACSRAVQRLADRCQQACRRSCQAAGREDAAVQLLNRPALRRRRRHGIMVESWASDCPWAAFVKGPHPWKDNVTCLTRRPRPERATSDGRPVSHARGHGETGHRRLASQKPVLTWRFSRSMHVATGRATQSTRHVLP